MPTTEKPTADSAVELDEAALDAAQGGAAAAPTRPKINQIDVAIDGIAATAQAPVNSVHIPVPVDGIAATSKGAVG